jgi:hypothetical protein
MRSMKGEARPRAAPSVSQPAEGTLRRRAHTHDRLATTLPALRTRQQQGVRADVRIASVAA